MASVWKHPKSQFWTACFTDKNGRRRKRSTKERSRPRAERIADGWEAMARGKRTMHQMQRVICDLSRELLGAELATLTIPEFLKRWLAAKRGEIAAGTYKNYRTIFARFEVALTRLGRKEFHEIQREDIIAWRDGEAERKSANSVNTDLMAVRLMLKDARADGLLATDPTEGVRYLSTHGQARMRRPFTEAELQAVLRAADQEWRSMIIFGYYTSHGIAEQAKLSWADIDLSRRLVRYVRKKTEKAALVPIHDALYDHILTLPGSDDPAAKVHPKCWERFQRAGGRSSGLGSEFSKILLKAGLRQKRKRGETAGKRRRYEVSFHALRHTAISDLQREGVSATVAGEIAGQSSVRMTKLYTHVDDEQKRSAVAKLKKLKAPERDLFDWGRERA